MMGDLLTAMGFLPIVTVKRNDETDYVRFVIPL